SFFFNTLAVPHTDSNHCMRSCWLSRLFSMEWLARGQQSITVRWSIWHILSVADVFNQLRATLHPLARLPENSRASSCMVAQSENLLGWLCSYHNPRESR